jgi:hypothetical protein
MDTVVEFPEGLLQPFADADTLSITLPEYNGFQVKTAELPVPVVLPASVGLTTQA